MHDSAVAERAARARGRASRTSSSIGLSVAREEVLLERLDERRLELVGARLRARAATKRSTWISKSRAQIVTSTPSPSPPAAGERLRDRRLARRRRSAARGAPARCARASSAAPARVSSARGQSALQLARRARQRDRDAVARVEHERRRRARRGRPRARRPGSVACFARPSAKSAYGRRSRSATARESASICALELARRRTSPRRPRAASSSTVRSSWVGPRPPETTQQVVLRGLARARASSSAAPSPTIVIRAGSTPRREQRRARGTGRCRSLRSPRTSSRARDDDRRARRAAQREAVPTPSAVTVTRRGLPPGTCTRLPQRPDARGSPGEPTLTQKRLPLNAPAARPARSCPGRAAPGRGRMRPATVDVVEPRDGRALERTAVRDAASAAVLACVCVLATAGGLSPLALPRGDHDHRHDGDRGERDRTTSSRAGGSGAAARRAAARACARASCSSPATKRELNSST